MQFRLLALLAAITPFALADIEFTSPTAGAKLTGGGSISIEWQDSGSAPSISDLTTYQLFLCAGGNDDTTFVSTTRTKVRLRLLMMADSRFIIGPTHCYHDIWDVCCWQQGDWYCPCRYRCKHTVQCIVRLAFLVYIIKILLMSFNPSGFRTNACRFIASLK